MVNLLALTLCAAPGFAFSDGAGARLLSLDPVENASAVTTAICGGRPLPIRFVKHQPAGERDTGRKTARNFSQVEGALFKVVKGRAPADTVCLLAAAAALAHRKVRVVADEAGGCADEARRAAEALGQRPVLRCERVGVLDDARLSFATYVEKGDALLVALVLTRPGAPAAARLFPAAKGPDDAPSCWRADDGCEFPASSYRVVAALEGPGALELFALWDGPEGQNAELLRVQGARLEVVASASRYWAPE